MLLFGRQKYLIMKYTTKDIAVSVCKKKIPRLDTGYCWNRQNSNLISFATSVSREVTAGVSLVQWCRPISGRAVLHYY